MSDEKSPVIEVESGPEVIDFKKGFLDMINRGGLVTPSDLIHVTCSFAFAKAHLGWSKYTKGFHGSRVPPRGFCRMLCASVEK